MFGTDSIYCAWSVIVGWTERVAGESLFEQWCCAGCGLGVRADRSGTASRFRGGQRGREHSGGHARRSRRRGSGSARSVRVGLQRRGEQAGKVSTLAALIEDRDAEDAGAMGRARESA